MGLTQRNKLESKMSAELVTTGTIVKASNSACIVSVIVGTQTKVLSFSKAKFYSYGLKCDGDMTNLLDEGMEVELCISFPPDNPPQVLIAWLGDQPEVVDEEKAFKPVYDQRGFLTGVWLSDFVVESHCGKVAVNKLIVFRDGEHFAALTMEDDVRFDAVPLEDVHVTGASYYATCAWVGRKPRLLDRFRLEQTGNMEVDREDVTGTGIVVAVPNDVVAIADVELKNSSMKVLVFRSSFKEGWDRIQDAVEVGDKLRMELSQGCVFPGMKLWFARVAVKGDLPTQVVDGRTGKHPTEVVEEKTGKRPIGVVNGRNGEHPIKVVERKNGKHSFDGEAVAAKASVKVGPETLYCNFSLIGVISCMPGSGYVISYGGSKVYLDGNNFYQDGKRASYHDLKSFATPGKNSVKFEAVAMNREGEEYAEFSHEATCAWFGKKPTLGAVAAHLPPPNYKLLKENGQIFYGIVSKICFPWIALVKIPELTTSVSVHTADLMSNDRRNGHWDLISRFVKLGDCVQFKVERRAECWNFLCAYQVRLVKFSKELYDDVNSGRLSRKPKPPEKG